VTSVSLCELDKRSVALFASCTELPAAPRVVYLELSGSLVFRNLNPSKITAHLDQGGGVVEVIDVPGSAGPRGGRPVCVSAVVSLDSVGSVSFGASSKSTGARASLDLKPLLGKSLDQRHKSCAFLRKCLSVAVDDEGDPVNIRYDPLSPPCECYFPQKLKRI
jgi:hypothetical protein